MLNVYPQEEIFVRVKKRRGPQQSCKQAYKGMNNCLNKFSIINYHMKNKNNTYLNIKQLSALMKANPSDKSLNSNSNPPYVKNVEVIVSFQYVN